MPKNDMPKVLCIEDDTDLLRLLKLRLELAYLDLEVFTQGDTALHWHILNSGAEQAVISDYLVPGMNGVQLYQELKESGWNGPFILISARPKDDIPDLPVDPLFRFVQKPVDVRELVEFCRHGLRKVDSIKTRTRKKNQWDLPELPEEDGSDDEDDFGF